MGLFTNFKRSHRRNKAWNEAYRYRHANNFAEAAKVWEHLAPEALEYNELIYADDCRDAFKLYLQAKDPESALRNARNALRVISDSGWITKSDSTLDDICAMVGELYGAGDATAAEIFSNEITPAPLRNEARHVPHRLSAMRRDTSFHLQRRKCYLSFL